MFKKLCALSFVVTTAAYSMDLKQITKISVETISKGYVMSVQVNDHTVIRDVKEALRDDEGFPVNMQRLNTVQSTWLGFHSQQSWHPLFGYSNVRSDALRNDQNVKAVMSEYETDRFELSFITPTHNNQ